MNEEKVKVLKLTSNVSEVQTVYCEDVRGIEDVLGYWLGTMKEWQDDPDVKIEITPAELTREEFDKLDYEWL